MKTSVIVPAFQADWCIERCLDSIYRQSVRADEVLLGVDNCDTTLQKAKQIIPSYPGLRVFWFPIHIGCYIIRNTLAELAEGDYLVFFDADDEMLPRYIENMINYDPNVIMRPLGYNITNGKRTNKLHKGHGIIALHKEKFLGLNGFEPWWCAADTEFLQRSAHAQADIRITENIICNIHKHGKNLTAIYSKKTPNNMREKYHKEIQKRHYQPKQKASLVTTNCEELDINPATIIDAMKTKIAVRAIYKGVGDHMVREGNAYQDGWILTADRLMLLEQNMIASLANQTDKDFTVVVKLGEEESVFRTMDWRGLNVEFVKDWSEVETPHIYARLDTDDWVNPGWIAHMKYMARTRPEDNFIINYIPFLQDESGMESYHPMYDHGKNLSQFHVLVQKKDVQVISIYDTEGEDQGSAGQRINKTRLSSFFSAVYNVHPCYCHLVQHSDNKSSARHHFDASLMEGRVKL